MDSLVPTFIIQKNIYVDLHYEGINVSSQHIEFYKTLYIGIHDKRESVQVFLIRKYYKVVVIQMNQTIKKTRYHKNKTGTLFQIKIWSLRPYIQNLNSFKVKIAILSELSIPEL